MEHQHKYTLYTYFRSSATWRVRIALNLKNIKVDYQYVNLLKGQQKQEQYAKINPNKAVPALLLSNGTILVQSVAIIQYLDEVHPEIKLYPQDPIIKAQVRGFCQIINSGIQPFHNLRLLEKVQKQFKADRIEFCKDFVKRGLQALETILAHSKGKYCFGDQITAADVFFAPQIQASITRFGAKLSDYPNIESVYNNIKDIDAFVQAEPKNQADFV